jgi:hypothetical protein
MRSKVGTLLILGALWVGTPSVAQGYDKSVDDIMASQPTPSDIDYVVDRCAGLMAAILSVTPEDSPLYTVLLTRFGSLNETAIEIRKLKGGSANSAQENSMNTTKMFASTYVSYLNDSYIRTSNYIEHPLVNSDLRTCAKVIDMLQDG